MQEKKLKHKISNNLNKNAAQSMYFFVENNVGRSRNLLVNTHLVCTRLGFNHWHYKKFLLFLIGMTRILWSFKKQRPSITFRHE